MAGATTWSVGLHQTVRILTEPSQWLTAILSADGKSEDQVLAALPYAASRSRGGTGAPDPRRYRDARQVVQTLGLAYEGSDSLVHVTALGRATLRWLPELRASNAPALGRHAAYALSACRLRNPMGAGSRYDASVTARPFAYLWRAMLALDDVINSDELNQGLFYAVDEDSLVDCIARIRHERENPGSGALFAEVDSGSRKNDRIVPIVAAGSFGYTFLQDKREVGGGYYRVRPETRRVVESAARADYPLLDFDDVPAYVEHISNMAALPEDVR